jgi:putative ABC transport system permease protein
MQDGNIRKYHPTPLCGVISDFKLGTLKEESTGRITLANITTEDVILEWGGYLMAKVNIDEEEAKKRIEEFCIKNGYKDYMFNAYVMRDLVENNIKEEKNMIKLLTGFSFICILMTVLTIVGLSSYHNKTTEKDNAIRNVFGCSKKELIRKIILDFVLPVVISAAVAIPIAYTTIGRWLEGYVIRTDNSPGIYLGALAAVLLITTASVANQALRLMRTNPAEALKKE